MLEEAENMKKSEELFIKAQEAVRGKIKDKLPSEKYRYWRHVKEDTVDLHQRYFFSEMHLNQNTYALEKVLEMFKKVTEHV